MKAVPQQRGMLSEVVVVHAVMLLAEPMFGAAALALLPSGTTLAPTQDSGGFLRVQHDEQLGYLPAAACSPLAVGSSTQLLPTQVGQEVWLYAAPLPGKHSPDPVEWMIKRDERLLSCRYSWMAPHRP